MNKILKTLDRLVGISSCVTVVPVAALVSTASFVTDMISATSGHKEAKWAANVVRQCTKTLAYACANTMKYGAVGCITNKESRLNALKESAGLLAAILEIPVEKVMEMSYFKVLVEEYSKDMNFTDYLNHFERVQQRLQSEVLIGELALVFGQGLSKPQVANA